jgi:hypothetical protein
MKLVSHTYLRVTVMISTIEIHSLPPPLPPLGNPTAPQGVVQPSLVITAFDCNRLSYDVLLCHK